MVALWSPSASVTVTARGPKSTEGIVFRRILTIGAAVVLAAFLAAASAPPGARSSGMTVAVGTVTSPGGAAVGGVTVDLYAWPSDAVLAALRPGQIVPRTLLATAVTGAAGRYAVQVSQARLTAAAVDGGYANLEIDTVAGSWFFPYQTSSPPGRPVVPATVNLGHKKHKWPCGWNSRFHEPYGATGWGYERPRAAAWAVVGQGYIVHQKRTRGDWLKFLYGQGNAHSQASALGIGISGYGFDAGYTSDGAHMSSSTQYLGFGKWYGNSWFQTQFNTGQYRTLCIGHRYQHVPHQHQHGQCPKRTGPGGTWYVHKCLWMIHSRGWAAGTHVLHPKKAPAARHCTFFNRKSIWHSDYGVAVRWSHGFTVGAALNIRGVNLKAFYNSSSQTGYDTNALMEFKFRQNGFLCGTNRPVRTAQQLVQRASKP
jgi:hypothetical protein